MSIKNSEQLLDKFFELDEGVDEAFFDEATQTAFNTTPGYKERTMAYVDSVKESILTQLEDPESGFTANDAAAVVGMMTMGDSEGNEKALFTHHFNTMDDWEEKGGLERFAYKTFIEAPTEFAESVPLAFESAMLHAYNQESSFSRGFSEFEKGDDFTGETVKEKKQQLIGDMVQRTKDMRNSHEEKMRTDPTFRAYQNWQMKADIMGWERTDFERASNYAADIASSVVFSGGTAVISGMIGGPILAGTVMFGLEAMPFYKDVVLETMKERDAGNRLFINKDGTKWTDEEVFIRSQLPAIGYGAMASIIETAGMGYITKGFYRNTAKKLMKKQAKEAALDLGKFLKKVTSPREVLGMIKSPGFWKSTGLNAVAGGFEETGQYVADVGFKSLVFSEADSKDKPFWGEVSKRFSLEELRDNFVGGVFGSVLFGVGTAGQNVKSMKRFKRDARNLAELSDVDFDFRLEIMARSKATEFVAQHAPDNMSGEQREKLVNDLVDATMSEKDNFKKEVKGIVAKEEKRLLKIASKKAKEVKDKVVKAVKKDEEPEDVAEEVEVPEVDDVAEGESAVPEVPDADIPSVPKEPVTENQKKSTRLRGWTDEELNSISKEEAQLVIEDKKTKEEVLSGKDVATEEVPLVSDALNVAMKESEKPNKKLGSKEAIKRDIVGRDIIDYATEIEAVTEKAREVNEKLQDKSLPIEERKKLTIIKKNLTHAYNAILAHQNNRKKSQIKHVVEPAEKKAIEEAERQVAESIKEADEELPREDIGDVPEARDSEIDIKEEVEEAKVPEAEGPVVPEVKEPVIPEVPGEAGETVGAEAVFEAAEKEGRSPTLSEVYNTLSPGDKRSVTAVRKKSGDKAALAKAVELSDFDITHYKGVPVNKERKTKKSELDKVYETLTPEGKEEIDLFREMGISEEKTLKKALRLAEQTAEGNNILKNKAAEKSLEEGNASIEERVAARYALEYDKPFGPAQIADVMKTIRDEKFDEVTGQASWSDDIRVLKKIYDEEVASFEHEEELAHGHVHHGEHAH